MNILYVYAHPSASSFNFQLKQYGCETLQNLGHNLIISDLYAENFNAIAKFSDFDLPDAELNPQYFLSQKTAFNKKALSKDIEEEIEKILWANHIIFQFPLWWFSVPAILKGWFDRILIKGFAYDTGKTFSDGLLKGKTASLVVTTQSGESAYQLDGVHGTTIDVFLHPIHHTLRLVGLQILPSFVEYEVFNLDEIKQDTILMRYKLYLQNIKEIKQPT